MKNDRRTSFRKNLMVAFLLIVVVLGISVTTTSQYALKKTLYEAGLDDHAVSRIGREFVVRNTVLTLTAVALSLLITSLLCRIITRRLGRLNAAVERLISGNLCGRVSISGDDEFADLGRCFNEMAVARDITDHKQTEQRLKANEEKYRRLVEDLGPEYFFYKHDTDGVFTYVSRSAYELLEYEEGKFVTSYADLLTDNPINEECMKHTTLSIQGVQQPTYEVEVRDRKGGMHLLEVTEHPVFELGRVVAVEGIAHDITQRKKIDQTLRKSERQLSDRNKFLNSILESLTHPFCVVDANTYEIKMANSALSRERRPGETTCYACTHGRTQPCSLSGEKCPLEEIKRTGKPCIVEQVHVDAKHRKRNVEVHGYPVFDEQGNISEVIEYAIDITDRKKSELQQTQLLEKLENVNKELKDFAYIVSHDLKAPLRGIAALASWIESDSAAALKGSCAEHLEMLVDRVKKMEKLIDGVLEYSRVGRSEEKLVRADLNEVVAGVIELVSPPKNITIEIKDWLPTVTCGRTRIEQVFQNLISNAAKYMDKPHGVIRIGCESRDGFWRFSVSDNGPGIEQRHFDRIFDIFQTLRPSDESDSTGVGLTVAKKIVETYGGRIWVESTPGRGSTFYFTLKKQLKSAGGGSRRSATKA